jgi:hypothetical protein
MINELYPDTVAGLIAERCQNIGFFGGRREPYFNPNDSTANELAFDKGPTFLFLETIP